MPDLALERQTDGTYALGQLGTLVTQVSDTGRAGARTGSAVATS